MRTPNLRSSGPSSGLSDDDRPTWSAAQELGPAADDVPPLLTARTVTGVVAGAVAFVLALTMLLISPPYAVHSPGPTVDTIGNIETIGDSDDEPLITVDGAPTYPTDGQLLLTTVSTRGGPGYPVTTGQVITGWLSSDVTVVPREVAYDPGRTSDEISEESSMQMASSQTNASVAALVEAGFDVPTELSVIGTVDDGPVVGLLEPEDRVEWIETDGAGRTEITTFEVLTGVLARTPPGSTVTVGVRRDGQQEPVPVSTGDDGAGGSVLGVYLQPEAQLPVDVEFAIENIGGPSGGLMLALGIVDVLTPGAITGGEVVAGTGTITIDGDVGPIGGIAQKLVGARDAGATWFLAPVENCAEVVGRVPDGLGVVAVDTLDDAVTALEAIAAGDTGGLASCAAS
ncbi:S16 family serine protease [Georgenia sp. MJ173]|uniref:YlbL family protein n=1 Tax=Georgenia sunbinii TaxID=3117728 RepID=UPI002F263042